MPVPIRPAAIGALCAAAAIVAATGMAPVALAKEPIAEYRQAIMDAIGGHTGALKQIITGKVAFPQSARVHAEALAALAKMAEPVFPAGSGADTDALPAIWEKPEAFAKAMAAFQTAAADLGKQAGAPPADMANAFGALVKTCKGCHDDFRKKD
jgi:cytochrome c556